MVVFYSLLWSVLIFVSSAEGPVVEVEQFNHDAWHPTNTIRFDDTSKPNRDVTTGVVWENCNTSSVNIYIRSLNTTPYPIPLRQPWALTDFILDIKQDVGNSNQPVEMSFSFEMLIKGQWVQLCEWIKTKRCYYPDMCDQFRKLFKKLSYCPQILVAQGSNCSCPIKAKRYNFPSFFVPKQITLPFKIEGTFRATVVLRTNGKDTGCLKMKFCIERC